MILSKFFLAQSLKVLKGQGGSFPKCLFDLKNTRRPLSCLLLINFSDTFWLKSKFA